MIEHVYVRYRHVCVSNNRKRLNVRLLVTYQISVSMEMLEFEGQSGKFPGCTATVGKVTELLLFCISSYTGDSRFIRLSCSTLSLEFVVCC
jgi:hypothetical protein